MSHHENRFAEFAEKMTAAGCPAAAIRAFQAHYETLIRGESGMVGETEIEPVENLPQLENVVGGRTLNPALLAEVVVVKLNGGLGTSMGLEKAKSLLEVKDALTFLDVIARQVLFFRKKYGVPVRFLLMNSFSTSRDTLDYLKRYPELGEPASLELMQNQAPKVHAQTLRPMHWSGNPQLEWCPPGHGDIYPALLGSGWLDRLLDAGVRFMFVSNSDNLGASLDFGLLNYFATSGKSFLMEVAKRTASDRKGGHLAKRNGRLLLRESAQCPENDLESFQDIQRHRFFNTNNLWVRLDALRDIIQARGGFIPLPMIKNAKTVDPRDKHSPAVFQLESAMGAAIESFENADAVVVPRTRFAPVKTTADLLALRSDAYDVTEDWQIVLAREGAPPVIDLDAVHYKLVDQLDEKLRAGVPSLKECTELRIQGPLVFSDKVQFRGKVSLGTASHSPVRIPDGSYEDCRKQI